MFHQRSDLGAFVLLECAHDLFGDGKDGDVCARVFLISQSASLRNGGLDATSIKSCYEAETVTNELMATQ
jgi:hypothetical protein